MNLALPGLNEVRDVSLNPLLNKDQIDSVFIVIAKRPFLDHVLSIPYILLIYDVINVLVLNSIMHLGLQVVNSGGIVYRVEDRKSSLSVDLIPGEFPVFEVAHFKHFNFV